MNKLFRQISRQAWSLVAACSMFLGLSQSSRAFVHPGIPFTTADINQLKANINTAPWNSGYAALQADSHALLSYGMKGPAITVGRAPDVNLPAWTEDMVAIHHLTWMWVFTNNAAYAQKATDMLDAWAVTNTRWTGDETFLAIGDWAQFYVTAADILKSTYPGWTAANTAHVNNYFANVLWPEVDVPNPVRGNNQGAIQLKAAMGIAAFLDDTTKWNQAVASLRTDAGGGLPNSLPNGEVGDSGRDEGHWAGQITALAWNAEVAWKQGIDVYGDLGNRMLAAGELYSQYAINTAGLTFVPFGGTYGYYGAWGYGGGARRVQIFYNIIQGAYPLRKGIAAPFSTQLSSLTGEDATTFIFKKSADSSTASVPPAMVHPSTAPATNLTDSDVGAVGLAGSASYDSGTSTWTINGAGADIPVPPLDAPDAFNFAFQQISGDTVIVARVASTQGTAGSKVGLMFRESLAPNAKYVGVFLDPALGVADTWRGATAWTKTQTSWFSGVGGFQNHGGVGAPRWLKIERLGSRFGVYHSSDGVSWTCLSMIESPLSGAAYAGLCVSSHNSSALNTATFDNVAITNPAPAGSPVISSATAVNAIAGTPLSYAATATNTPASFAATGLPAGLGIDSSGVISGTPTTPGTFLTTLSATNASGTGTAVLVFTVFNNVAPAAPTGLTASNLGGTQVGLSWTGSANATSYAVKRSLTAGGPYATIMSGITGTALVDATPYPGSNYYVVTALAGSSESPVSGEASVVLPPAIPTSAPTITNGNGQVILTWPAATGASSYNVKRSSVRGGPYATIASGVSAATHTDTSLTNGTYYYYVISSVSGALESVNSAEELGVPGATTYTWSPSAASGAWNTAANWVEGAVPVSPAILIFGASATATLTNDLPAGLQIARMTFNPDAAAYTIAGNAIALGNDITNNATTTQTLSGPATLTGSLALNATSGNITLGGVLSGSGAIVKNGFRSVLLSGLNTYSGGTTLTGLADMWAPTYVLSILGTGTGVAGAPVNGPLGTGPLYLKGGTLYASGATVYNDVVSLPGPQSVLVNEGGNLNLYGNLSGTGTIKYDGSVPSGSQTQLGGDNSGFTGTFTIFMRSTAARFYFNTEKSASAGANWVFNNTGADCPRINYAGTASFGSLSGSGAMRSVAGSPVVRVGDLNTSSEFTGNASGGLAIKKAGTGTFTLSGVNSYSGTTTVDAGVLLVNTPGSITSPVTVNTGAIFGGTGSSTNTVTVTAGATLAPGKQGIDTFTTTSALTLNTGATYAVELSSTDGLSDTTNANGVTLNNATLALTDIAPGTLPLGAAFTIINNTGSSAVSGTFNGLPEGAEISIGAYTFILTYQGGNGNDVKLHDKRTAALPSTVTNLTAAGANSSTINLSWTASPLTESVTAYSVKRSTTPGGPYATIATVGNTTYVDTGLIYNTPYYYVVSAANYKGSGPDSAEASATTPSPGIPPAPGNVLAAAGDGKINLSWSAAFEAVSYNVLRATTPGGPYTTLASGLTTTFYTDTTAVNGTAYYYVVTATNAVGGSSSASLEVGGTSAAGGFSYWTFNETSGTAATDVWGARTATLQGAGVTRVSGVSGNGLRFDGAATSYATVPAGVVSSLAGDFSLSVWAKFDTLANNQRILDFGTSNTNYLFISQQSSTTVRYAIKVGSGGEQGITSPALTLAVGKWVHVTVTQTGAVTALYINGSLVGSTSAITYRPSGLGATTANYFGKSQFPADPMLKGTLDDLRIYSRALSAPEVASIVNATAPVAPTTLTAVSAPGAVAPVTLTWTASPQATNYNIKRATVAGGPYTSVATNVIGTSYTDATATNGAYYYVVTSIAGAFEGAYSNEVSVLLLPAVVPASPAPVATGWNGRVDLNWVPATGATSYDIKRATVSGGPYVTVGSVPYTSSSLPAALIYSDTTVTNGATYYYVIAATNAGGSSAASAEVSATPLNDAVANAWSHADVGAVGFSGNAGYSGGTYTLYGSGADIWTTVDSFHFLYQPLSGDGAIMARIMTQSTTAETAASAKAGIMIRDNLTTVNSLNATVDRTPNSVVEFIRRSVTTTNAVATTIPSLSLPRWVRLVRAGNTFTAYHSADGLIWTTVLTPAPTITMGANTSVGLVFCANANGKRGQATFDHVSVANAAPVINSATTATGTFGVPFAYTITATNSPGLFTASGLPAGLTLNDATGVISGIPTAVGAGTYTVTLTAVNAIGASASVPLTLTIAKRTATVTLENLAQVYDGTQKVVTATTSPVGLAVDITYNGSVTAPTEAGSYTVVGTVHDTLNYEPASATATLVVAKIPGALLLGNLALNYDGTSRLATATTTPPGLTVLYTYDGLPLVITPSSGNLAAYAAATGQTLFVNTTGATTGIAYGSNGAGYAINSDLGTAAVHAGMLVSGQSAVLQIAVLADVGTYTGTTANGVTTQSAAASGGAFKIIGVAASGDYTTGPVSAGNHTVVATIADAHYSGSVTGTLVVAQAMPVLTWSAPAAITYGTVLGATQLNAAANTAGNFIYTPAAGSVLDAGSDQTLSVDFAPTDTVNYTSASAATTITVNKAVATVALANLAQTYTGAPRAVTGTTSPAGLPLVITYNGAVTAPTDAGSYTVVATINHANYVGSATGTLVIGKAGAAVTLGGLNQSYDGTPKSATATTSLANLVVNLTYNGSAIAPTYPGTYAVVATVDDPDYMGSVSGTLVIRTTVLVRHAPAMNSDIDGSLQQLLPENTTLNSGAMISGDLLVPGTPAVQLNGSPVFGGAHTGPGSASPSNYTITLNSNTLLRYLVRRIDPIAMPVVTAPPATSGTRDVTINNASQSIGTFATLRNLTLNNGAGLRAIPAGTYGSFALNGTSGIILGVAGATEPAVYNLQNLTINTQSGSTALQIVGPVILTLANGTQINALAGASAHPEWLILRIASGGFTINGSVTFHGSVVAPNGTVTLNSSSKLNGTVVADRLTLNGTSLVNDPNQ